MAIETVVSTPLEYALKYASIGLRVFPLRPGTKVPATPNGVKDATRDEATIRAWWTENPEYGVALAPEFKVGGACFLEFDQRPWLPAWAKKCNEKKPLTRLHRSGGKGGPHYVFLHTEKSLELGNTNGAYNGHEWFSFRADNRYIVAPPSVHPDTKAEYTCHLDIEPIPIPDWLVAKIAREGVSESKFGEGLRQCSEDFDFDKFCDWLERAGCELGTEDGAWIPFTECPVVGRRHEGQGVRGCALFWDGGAIGFKCHAAECPSNTDRKPNQSGIGYLVSFLSQQREPYDGTIWDEQPIEEVLAEFGAMSADEEVGGKKEQTAGLAQPFNLTDLGNMERMVWRHGAKLKHTAALGWVMWDGTRWEHDEKGARASRMAWDTVRKIAEEAALVKVPELLEDKSNAEEVAEALALRDEIVSWAKTSEMGNHISLMLGHTEKADGVAAHVEQFDADPNLLNTRTCTVDLTTGESRAHDREDMLTKRANVDLDTEADCPLWRKFLSEVFDGKQEMVDFMQRALGYALTGETKEHKMFLLWGSGANGKTTLLETVRHVMGDYAQSAEFSVFVARKEARAGASPDIARMRGARFVSATEGEHQHKLAESLIKQLTGGDRIAARHLFKEYFEYTPQFKLFLATNHRPVIVNTDDGIWRRIMLVPFAVSFVGREDTQLREKLTREAPGILRWMIEGLKQWREHGLMPPQEVLAATADYRAEEDAIQRFVTDECVVENGATVGARQLWERYKRWADDNHEDWLKEKKFSDAMREHGYVKLPRTEKGVQYKHIRLADVEAAERFIHAEEEL